ncbi:MAG: polyketide cyclase [Rhodospirillales bacterium]|nr:polyketide cyclase [Rhodospirillales bacterium]
MRRSRSSASIRRPCARLETRISVSLATIEFKGDRAGTRLIFTEQGAFLDDFDKTEYREEGSRAILEALAKEFEGELAST